VAITPSDMRWNSKTKCSRKCRCSEPERLNFFHGSTYNSHVFNASQRCPLHRRQVRAAVNHARMVKIFELAATQYDRREHEEQQMGTTFGLRDWLRQPGAFVAERIPRR
jgi:hypothetical protein